jgi:acyl-CoA thioesterase-1
VIRHKILSVLVGMMATIMISSFDVQATQTRTILMLGDSLTAGYNLPASSALPSVLERGLKTSGIDIKMINGGVSGDTAAQGLARLDWMLNQRVDGVIVALGANDMLRGQPPAQTKQTLQQIINRLKARQIPIMLVGMKANPTLGADYVNAFDQIYPDLAHSEGLVLYPFMLDGVAGIPTLNLSDGLHPSAQGIELIARRMLPKLKEFIAKI